MTDVFQGMGIAIGSRTMEVPIVQHRDVSAAKRVVQDTAAQPSRPDLAPLAKPDPG
jgi:hypothetical protein